jgi:hypothetical protein
VSCSQADNYCRPPLIQSIKLKPHEPKKLVRESKAPNVHNTSCRWQPEAYIIRALYDGII